MNKRITTATFRKMKKEAEKITILTAYDYPTAKLMDNSGVDALLVGDSLGMAVLGYEDTTKVTMDDMLHHIKAVARGAQRAMVIGDMPFLSYHISRSESVKNAGRIIQEGSAQAVKLEGGKEVIEDIKAIIKAGIPVMGHIGLTPQSVHKFGGYFIQGKTGKQAQSLIDDAIALEEAGVFSIVLETIPAQLGKEITDRLSIPTIGIGAGLNCDGQVLVAHDMLGLFQGRIPKHVKIYTDIGEQIESATAKYVDDVKNGEFPKEEHSF
jgi:3-methyl-2-oxobutanoate hydroxymethyltransferase